jgi:ATP-dependent DNA helicase DinG
MKDIFDKDGLLAKKFKNYEYRPQQVKMFKAITDAIGNKEHLVIEAGTGIGKTFAYLIPAITHSLSTKKPVVVSTNTINLQEQIVYKDIPFLQSVLPGKFSAVLAKGRSNYICLRRLNTAIEHQTDLFEYIAEKEELKRIMLFADTLLKTKAPTQDGSISSLDWVPSENIWDKISSESDNCAGKRCNFFCVCFYQKARLKLYLANIVVVNHPLLIIDAVMRCAECVNLLPKYDVLIIDEAHRLESVAQNHLGIKISNYQIGYLLNSLWNPKKHKGFIQFLPQHLPKVDECKKLIEDAKDSSHLFFDKILAWFNNEAPENGRVKNVDFVTNPLSTDLVKIHFSLKELKQKLKPKNRKVKTDETELDSHIKRTSGFAMVIEKFIKQSMSDEEDEQVYWVEVSKSRRLGERITLQSAPLKVNNLLKQLLLENLSSCIFTSATLSTAKESVRGGLNYIKETLGIENSRDVILDSPFNYSKQAKLYIASNLPDPNDKDKFEPLASEKIMKFLDMTQGRAFILFTSYDLMNRVYDRIYPRLLEKGVPVYMQGRDLPRHQMLEEFRSRIGSVILGADSFWQGVDVPGEALENIIITKLPFPVPTEPLVEARMEEMEQNGIDSFMNYFLPEAILKLRQGFGRLIRTKTDKGIVVILDNRIITKNYGKLFLKSLPECPTVIE